MTNVMMIVYTLLLVVHLTSATIDTSRGTSRHGREGDTGTSRHRREGDTGVVSYQGTYNNNKAHSRAIHHERAGAAVKDCPSQCHCAFKRDPHFGPKFILKLVVQDCTSDPFEELPKFFNSHRNKTILEFDNCHLSRLPKEIVSMRRLFGLYLIGNELRELPSQLQQLPLLTWLLIEANKVEYVETGNITKLSKLPMLGQNRLYSLPKGIWRLTQLKILSIEDNNLGSLPKGIDRLSQLIALNSSYNKIHSLPKEIFTLPFMTLDLCCNELETIPHELGNLTRLIVLLLDLNQIKTLPSTIGKLTDLKGLTLVGNRIQVLPDEMRQLTSLLILNLTGNLLEEVPPLPATRLVKLSLSHNMIKTIPIEIFTGGHLEFVDLSYNNLTSFYCGPSLNTFLSALDLSHNAIEALSCPSLMQTLVQLDIGYNNISTIPKDCTPLTGPFLEWLSYSHNSINALRLQQLCSEKFLRSFRFISFRNNRIRTIDTTGSYLNHCFKTGAVIDLANNQLSTLDSWPLLLAEKIAITLDVSGNNLSEFKNSAEIIFLPTFKSGNKFLLQKNQIQHFMEVFDGWNIVVNTTKNFNTLLRNAYFDLAGNPLVCDCVDYEVYRYIQTLKTEQYNNLVCHEPLSLSGHNPYHIPLGNFVCDLDVNCPKGCTCVKVPHSQSVNVTCDHYIETDIPETVPDLPNEKYNYRLDFCHQNLSEITFRPYLPKATEIILSNNSIFAIKINSSTAFQRVRILHIDSNRLERLPESVADMTNETAVEVRLGSNPWVCDCEVMAMKNWMMLNLYILKDRDIIRCHSPSHLVGVKVMNIKRSMVCPNEHRTAAYIIGTIISAVFLFIVYLTISERVKYRKFRFIGSDECDGELKEFDIFLCACSADADANYVENYLIPELERRDYRVCYHREHFHGGKPIHVNMSEAIEKSKRTLAFFSNGFRASGYSMFEFHSAHDLDIQNKTRRLITIKDTNLDMRKLDISEVHYFDTYTYIAREDVKFWELLEGTLPKKRLGAQVRLPNT